MSSGALFSARRGLLGWIALGWAGALFSCAPVTAESPSRPVVERRPESYLPVDLEIALRLEIGRLRREAGSSVERAVEGLVDASGLEPAADPAGVLLRALKRAEVAWVGLRPADDWDKSDGVIILTGDFSVIPSDVLLAAFEPGLERGGGLRVYEARRVSSRASPARLYSFRDKIWIFSSVAELDALDRVIDYERHERGLFPPERGVLSVAARLGPLAERIARRSPKLSTFLEHAESLRGHFDLEARGLVFRLELTFDEEKKASRAREALRIFLSLLEVGSFAPSELHLELVTTTVVLDGVLPISLLQRL